MSICDIRIELDREDRSYQAGSRILGKVVVQPNKEMKCKSVKIEMAWETHGIGNKDKAVLYERQSESAEWVPGETYAYPFEFSVPDIPLTYHGSILNVDHYIRATVDAPWAKDPKAKEDFVVLPGKGSREAYLHKELKFEKQAGASCVGSVLGWIFLPLIIVLVLMLCVVALPILLIYLVVTTILRRMAEKKLGKVKVLIDAPAVNKAEKEGSFQMAARMWPGQDRPEKQIYTIVPGQEFGIGVEFRPASDVRVNKIVFELHGEEISVSGSGSNSTTHRHDIHKNETVLAEGAFYRGGELTQFVARIPVPPIEAYTFSAGSNNVKWKLRVRVDIPSWPDWTQEYELRMVPG